MEDFLRVAKEAAKRGGDIHKRFFKRDIKTKTKGREYDLLTEADLEAEKAIVGVIKKRCAGHNILAEENVYEKTDSVYTWVIDPLDGTNNFANNMPIFCSSVGLAKEGEVILGAVYDVMRDELFWAAKGEGAFMNGKEIEVSSSGTLTSSILITGFYYNRGREMERTLKRIKEFLSNGILGIRRLGSAALDLCYIACGRASGFWECELSPWDFAAGKILVEEAGGNITDSEGRPLTLKNSSVVASNGKIHEDMLEIINGAF